MRIDMRAELWKTIDGYNGRYQVNPFGQVRRVCKKKFVVMNAYRNISNWMVRLSYKGKSKAHIVSNLVAAAFLPCPAEGYVLWHKNGVLHDNFVGNLEWITRSEMARRAALLANKRRVIAKISPDGEVVDFYRSAQAAAAANYVSQQAVLDRCNGRIRDPFKLIGYTFAFDEDVAI